MVRKLLLLICVPILLVSMMLGACTTQQEEKPTEFTIGGGGTGGTFYAGACAIMTIINDNVEGLRATALATGGSLANIREIDRGEMLFGLAAESAAAEGYAGTGEFDTPQHINLIGFIGGSIALFVTTNPDIHTLEDIRGKAVAVGEPGATDAGICMAILKGVGLEEGDYTAIQLGEFEGTAALVDGRVDVIFNQTRPGKPAIVEITSTKKCFFPMIPAGKMDAVSKALADAAYPNSRGDLPAGCYKGLDEDYESFYAPSAFIVDARADEDLVYRVTKAWWENIDVMAQVHVGFTGLKPDNIKGVELHLPLHPGALKYYKEIGILSEDPFKG